MTIREEIIQIDIFATLFTFIYDAVFLVREQDKPDRRVVLLYSDILAFAHSFSYNPSY
jgi:hypothetical protein